MDPSWFPQAPEILYINGLSEWEFWKTLKFEKSEVTYANINDKNEIQINKVENLKSSKKNLILILNIELGINSAIEKKVDKHREAKPINEIIYILFSTDYFSLILFLLMQACNSHRV